MTCACLLMAGVGLASAPYAMKNGIAPAGVGGYPVFFSAPVESVAPTPSLQDTAWDTLRALTSGAEHLDQQTTWEREWDTKCEVKLEACPSVAPIPGATPASRIHRRIGSNLKIARQTQAETEPVPDHQPSFSLIWFNPAAARSVAKGIRSLEADQPVDAFEKGATIVKAIWSLVPVSAPAGLTTSKLTVSRINCVLDECFQPARRQTLFNIPEGELQSWHKAPIDFSPQTAEPACDQDAAIPINCLHAFLLDSEKTGDVEVTRLDPAVNTTCGHQKCLVVLVGIHIMKRVAARDVEDASGWEFMTFWWTGQDNRIPGLKGPWRYFQMNATRTPRNDAGGPQGYNIVYNPYLEGSNPAEQTGAVANCLTCHGFAAYDTSPAHPSKMPAGIKPCTGAPSIPAAMQCQGQFTAYGDKTAPYWQGAVGTNDVWSFSTFHPLPASPPPH